MRGVISPQLIIGAVVGLVVLIAVAIPTTIDSLKPITQTYAASDANTSALANGTSFYLGCVNATGSSSCAKNGIVSASETLTDWLGGTAYSLTRNTNYTIDNAKGLVTLTNVNATGNVIQASYSYYQDSYYTNSAGRTVLDILPLFLAVVGITFLGYLIIGRR